RGRSPPRWCSRRCSPCWASSTMRSCSARWRRSMLPRECPGELPHDGGGKMAFAVVSLGGPMAPEGEEMLRAAGAASVATAPYPKKEEMRALLADCRADAIIVRLVARIDEDIMRASPNLKVIAKHGAGTNDIDVAAARRLGIPVLAAVGSNSHSVA